MNTLDDSGAVLVTGASRGIGRGIAVELASFGFSVIINYRQNVAAAEESAALCSAAVPADSVHRPRFFPVQADISSAADRARLVAESVRMAGSIRALINNAGIAPRIRADITEATPESFHDVLDTNLAGPYFLTQEVVRHWLQKRNPEKSERSARQVVFVSSISADTASPSRGEYSIAKAGLAMAAKLWASRLASENIQVIEVRPGIMQTDMTAGVKDRYDELIADGLVPQKRWGFPEDVARICRAVVCGDFGFSTGSVIHADGGFHLSIL